MLNVAFTEDEKDAMRVFAPSVQESAFLEPMLSAQAVDLFNFVFPVSDIRPQMDMFQRMMWALEENCDVVCDVMLSEDGKAVLHYLRRAI